MVTGIEHIAVAAKDTAALKDWYARLFGFRQVYDNGKGTYFLKAQDGAMIEFIKCAEDVGILPEKASGIRHLAIAVDDFEGMVDILTRENVEVVTAPTVAPNGIKTFFFRDPEGNILHLIFRPQPL
jgi:catechol 2,3-dioxygenase-like lactoylglutathione lyase family enzyme